MPNVTPNRGGELSAARARQLYDGVDRGVSVTGTGSHTTRGFVPVRDWWRRKKQPPSLFQAGKTTLVIGNANLDDDFELGGDPAFTIPYIVGTGYTHTETTTDVTILRPGTYDLRIWAQIASMATDDVPSWPPYYSLAIWPRSSNATLSPAARMAWSSCWYDGYARDTLSAPNVLGAWLGAGAQAMSHQLAYLVNVPSDNAIFSVFYWASLAHVNWTMTVHMWVQLYGPLEYR